MGSILTVGIDALLAIAASGHPRFASPGPPIKCHKSVTLILKNGE
jgi:hypothetical protein